MKKLICLFVMFLLCCTFQQEAFAQKQVKKVMKRAVDNNTKVGKFYLAKIPKNKIVGMDMLTKYGKGDYIFQHLKFRKMIIYGEIKRVVTSFQFRNIHEAQREESALVKQILRTEKKGVATVGLGQSYPENDLVGAWEGEKIKFRLYSNGTYKMSNYNQSILGHWRSEEVNNSEAYTQIILSYAGIDLDSRLQVNSLDGEILKLKDLSDGSYYSLNKKVKSDYALSSGEQGLLFWGTVAAFLFLSSDSGSSSNATYKGEYSSDPDVDRYMRNAHEQDARAAGF